MSDVIRVEGQYYIRSTSSMADSRTLVLKHADTFAVFDRHGDIQPVGFGEQGIFHEGTRFLSQLVLTIDGERPMLLSSTVSRNNSMLAVDLTNPDLDPENLPSIQRDTLHILRSKFLWQDVCYERLHIANFGPDPMTIELGLMFKADFSDIFEVRGQHRPRRGRYLDPNVTPDGVRLSYVGLDDITRTTRITATPAPSSVTESELCFRLTLVPKEDQTVDIAIACEVESRPAHLGHDVAETAANALLEQERRGCVEMVTSNEQFNDWINQSMEDLHMLTTDTGFGPYPYAGIPWFNTAFGRDGIITALELLWVNPAIARGVLNYLAHTQATEVDAASDAEPGKILHETRRGEMAELGEIPFGMYYGSVDSTPLFVLLAGRYYDATADFAFIESIWPNIQAALHWIDQYGDLDGDGFVEYQRKQGSGLLHQGWKDSHDSVFHADGSDADTPIAICEMQAYVYAAKLAAARLAEILGHVTAAMELGHQASLLKQSFADSFWDEELGTYVLALDGHKRPCRVVSSNAGHALFAGIARHEHADRVARTLMADESFSGWGIRTVATTAPRYNPMSYHNGSVWPHDNALIADGLARYGHQDMAAEVLTGLFDSSIFVDQHRLPELYCGFPRRAGEGPTLYPVACAPQAWAAGAVFMILNACLGMSIDAPSHRLRFNHPTLPAYLEEVTIRNLRTGDATIDITFHRHPDDIGISILRRTGDVEVVVVK